MERKKETYVSISLENVAHALRRLSGWKTIMYSLKKER